jgi:hypothetical protein
MRAGEQIPHRLPPLYFPLEQMSGVRNTVNKNRGICPHPSFPVYQTPRGVFPIAQSALGDGAPLAYAALRVARPAYRTSRGVLPIAASRLLETEPLSRLGCQVWRCLTPIPRR